MLQRVSCSARARSRPDPTASRLFFSKSKRIVRVAFTQQDIVQASEMERLKDSLRRERTSELRARLDAIGGDSEGFFDMETLVDTLAEHYMQARSQLVAFRLRRTPLRPRGSKSHLVVPIDVDGVGFSDFLLDSGSSGVLITADMRNEIGVSPLAGRFMNGVDSSGMTVRQKVQLPTLRLGHRELDIKEAIVTKLELQEQVGGVLGLSFLRQVEVDLDLDNEDGTLTFHPLGHVELGILDVTGMTKLDLSVAKGGLMVLYASLNGSPPMPAIIDISASHTVVNGHAARLAGIEGDETDAYCQSPPVAIRLGAGLPSSSSNPTSNEHHQGHLPGPQGAMACSGQVDTTIQQPLPVRDLPSLAPLGLADGPVMILGMDLLCRSRAVFCFGSKAVYVQNPVLAGLN